MTIEINMSSKFLIDFVNCVEKSSKKPDYMYLLVKDHTLSILSETYDARVFLEYKISDGGSLSVGVSASEFINSIKKLNYQHLSLKISKRKVYIDIGNVSISYSTVSSDGISFDSNMYNVEIESEKLQWFTDSLIKCVSSVDTIMKDTLVFHSILLCGGNITYITRFTEATIKVCATEHIGFSGRLVLPLNAAKMVKSFKKSIKYCQLNDRHVSFLIEYDDEDSYIEGSLRASFPLMEDTYPEDTLSFLKLEKELPLIDDYGKEHGFKRDHLLQAIDLITATVSGESQVKFEIVGNVEGGLRPVWKLSSKGFKGTSCEELVAGSQPSVVSISPFSVSGKRMMKALESYGEDVILLDHSRSTIALHDGDHNDLVLLSKVAE